jgi:hypothetical protein
MSRRKREPAQLAGLIYHGGAWWVTSVRGGTYAGVFAGLREIDPDSPPRNLRAIAWTDQREADYQKALAAGAMVTITLRDPRG